MADIEQVLRAAEREVNFEFVRASGPGGQNVNKVATAVQLRFDVAGTGLLNTEARQRLKRLAGRRMTAAGVLLIAAQRYRTQEKNRADALERFSNLLRAALQPPKTHLKTRPTRGSVEKRLQRKKRRSEIKRIRQSGPLE
jgi:ribosome-associated protein